MKGRDLILITAHCPDIKRKNLLHDLVISLQEIRVEYDIMISSHTHLSSEITESVEYTYYDSSNKILKDIDFLSSAWFTPDGKNVISSSYVSSGNTYLAILRLWIPAVSIAKTMGYKNIHFLEYDALIKDPDFFRINTRRLEEFESVFYTVSGTSDGFMIGYYLCCQIESFPDEFKFYDEEKIKNIILNSPSKNPEDIIRNLLLKRKSLPLKFDGMLETGNLFGLNQNVWGWFVPYFYDDHLYFLGWNTLSDFSSDVTVITNGDMILSLSINSNCWSIRKIRPYEEVSKVEIIVNSTYLYSIDFNQPGFKDKFKFKNYSKETETFKTNNGLIVNEI